jgi:hypothetical protein
VSTEFYELQQDPTASHSRILPPNDSSKLGCITKSPQMPRDDDAPDLQPEETCRQCPTQTLRSQCPHTAEGRQYLKKNRHPRQSVHYFIGVFSPLTSLLQTPESSNSCRPPWFNQWSPSKSLSNPGPPHYYSWPGPVPAYGMPVIQSQPIVCG